MIDIMYKRLLTRATHKIHTLPVLVLMPHSACNCRCVMCDIWKANHDKKEISPETLATHIEAFRNLNVKHVTLSGGEALMHSNLWKLCEALKAIGVRISLLSTGVTLKRHAEEVVRHVDDVIVSIDGSAEVHNRIRNIPLAFQKLQEGVAALRERNPSFRITARCVLQKLNFRDLPNIVASTRQLRLDQISFLPADTSSTAFNRTEGWTVEKIADVRLDEQEVGQLKEIVEASIIDFADLYRTRFIAESPRKMRELVQYYEASCGLGRFPKKECNAPWVSAVIEADGSVRPCFFHKAYGNIYEQNFSEVINSPEAIHFRKKLNMKTDAVCERCVCSLKLGLRG